MVNRNQGSHLNLLQNLNRNFNPSSNLLEIIQEKKLLNNKFHHKKINKNEV